MKSVNTHGIKINGIRKTSGMTKDYGYYSGHYVEIFYDKGTGDVWGKHQCSFGWNSWTVYHDADIIKICNTSSHMNMQDIADAILEKLNNDYDC